MIAITVLLDLSHILLEQSQNASSKTSQRQLNLPVPSAVIFNVCLLDQNTILTIPIH